MASPAAVELSLQAYPRLVVGGRRVPLALKRAWGLVARLAESDRRIARASVAALLWPDADPGTGRARLRRLVHQLNGVAGVDLVAGDVDAVWLAHDALALDVDWTTTRRAALAMLDGNASEGDDDRLLAEQSHAVLDGFDLDSDAFEAWLATRRQDHAQLVVRALQRLAERSLAAGDADRALVAARRLLAVDPYADAGHALVIAALGRKGEGTAMEAAYDECARLVREEFGVRPSAAIEAAYAAAKDELDARRAEPTARVRARSGGASPSAAPLRYAETSRGAVAYVALGDGPETLLLVPEAWSHVETTLDDAYARAALDRLAKTMRVVVLDRRGTGLSDRTELPNAFESAIEDVQAVLDALSCDAAWLLGTSTCGSAGIELAVRAPSRVRGLVLAGVQACGTRAPGYPWALDGGARERWIAELEAGWGEPTGLNEFAPTVAHEPGVQRWWTRTFQQASSKNRIGNIVRMIGTIDVRPRLADVRVPTMILQRADDRVVREGAARYLADSIDGAELRVFDGSDHYWFHGESAPLLDAIEDFVARHPRPAVSPDASTALEPAVSDGAGDATATPVRYARSADGVRLAYEVSGQGPPLIKASNWLSHLAFDRASPVWGHLVRALAAEHRYVRYDERGCGLSDWDVADLSFESWVRDLETVVDAVGADRFPLLGISQGASIAIAYAVRHPERVERLILHGGYARGRLVRSATAAARADAETMARLAELGWGSADPVFRQYFTNQFIPGGSAEQQSWFNELERISTSPQNAARFMRVFNEIDVTQELGRVRCPTLVLHSEGDLRVALAEGRLIAEGIPGARFVPIASGNHLLLAHEPGWPVWLAEVRAFLSGSAGPTPPCSPSLP